MEIILAEEGTKPKVCIVTLFSILFGIIQGSCRDLSVNNSKITSRNNERGIRFGIFEEIFFAILLGRL
jgi:hypothetical protein